MKILRNNKIILFVIIILAFVLRFWQLNSYPALNADEASIGYDAYSLITTGKDQHGNAWPVNFQSFNDYKPGLYVYIVLPFVKFLGLNEWAVRIPNAFFGVMSVYVAYLLIKELFGKEKEKFALMGAMFLAISPWHIHFSRGGWEANTATFFIALGVLFFVKGARIQNVKYKVLSVLFFVLSMYCYQATRVVAPLIGIGLVLIFRKEVISNVKPFLVAGIVGFLLLVPLLLDFTKGAALSRAAGVGLFADTGPRARVEEQRGEHNNISNIFVKAVHNKIVNYGIAFVENWGKHFHGEFLFLSGDEVQRNRIPETGVMYLTDIVFLLVGVIFIFRSKLDKSWQIVLMWVLVAPLASALTFQAPSALRAENMIIPLVIISSFGVVNLIDLVRVKLNKNLRNAVYIFACVLVLWSFARYQVMYWVHMAKEYSYSSQYGLKELVNYVEEVQDKYQKILVTDRYDQPYILFLFYGAADGVMKYPPQKFQAEHTLTQRDQFGLSTVNHFGKYYFASIKYDQARVENPNTLIVGTDGEIPKEANIVKYVYGTNGFLYFKAVAN